MMILPDKKFLLVVDPDTGLVIPHVKEVQTTEAQAASHPDHRPQLILYLTTPAPIPMQVIENGVTTERPYTFVVIRNLGTGQREYMTWCCDCRFDLVDKRSGEVLLEAQGQPVPLKAADPEAYCRQLLGRSAEVEKKEEGLVITDGH